MPIATLTIALKMRIASTFLSRPKQYGTDGRREPSDPGPRPAGIEKRSTRSQSAFGAIPSGGKFLRKKQP
jgi:hypothetical protein